MRPGCAKWPRRCGISLPTADHFSESELAWYPITDEGPYHKAARRLQKSVPPEAHLWCAVKHAVSEGQPYREILNYATRNEIDLIFLGAHGSGFGLLTLFGPNVDRVLRQAPCPVLVARPLRHAHSTAPEKKVTSHAGKSTPVLARAALTATGEAS